MTRTEAKKQLPILLKKLETVREVLNQTCRHTDTFVENDHDGWSVCSITYTTVCTDCRKVLKKVKSDY